MRALASAVFMMCASATSALSQGLPTSGSCEQVLVGDDFRLVPTITWVGQEALVQHVGKTYRGKVVGMRRHDSSFKFSIFYRDDIMGFSEISIFRIPQSRPAQDRIGIVYFEELPQGERVVKAMSGFRDAKCAIQF